MSKDKEHIDDIFKNHFEDYEPTPPGNVWSRVKSGLGNNNPEETLYNKFEKHQPQPPMWVWASLNNILKDRQRAKLYKRVAAASLFFITIGGLIASQFAANHTIDSLFAFEKDDQVNIKTLSIQPVSSEPNVELVQPTPNKMVSQPQISFSYPSPSVANILNPTSVSEIFMTPENVSPNTLTSEQTPVEPTSFENTLENLSNKLFSIAIPELLSSLNIPNAPHQKYTYRKPPVNKPTPSEFGVEFYGGVANTFRQLDKNIDASVSKIRQESERSGAATQWGIRFNLNKKGLYVSGGLELSNYNYSGTYVFLKSDSVNLHPYLPTTSGGFSKEDYFVAHKWSSHDNVQTTYKFASFTGSVGYAFRPLKWLSVIPKVGVKTSYLLSDIGPKLQAGRPTEFTAMADAKDLSAGQRLMVSGTLALKLEFKMSKNINLGVESYMNNQLNTHIATSPLGGQKLMAKGLNLTLGYKF